MQTLSVQTSFLHEYSLQDQDKFSLIVCTDSLEKW